MKNLKKKLAVLAVITLLPLLVIGIVIAVIDPFFVYHAPLEGAYYVVDNQLEQNPGLAKHFEYDSVMLGSSMTTNFDTNIFNDRLGCNMIKLSYNAAYPHDIDKIMGIVTQEKDTLKYAFLCIDIANYMNEPGMLSYSYPEHLYDDNVFNDLKYLINKNVLLDYVVMPYLRKREIKVNEIYWHWQHMNYSKEHVLSNYVVPEKTYIQTGKYSIENLVENLETYIVPYIEATPDTKWAVFFPPYSMLYWNDSLAVREVDIKLEGIQFITEYLAGFGNVEVYYFQDNEEWICDLNNYTDVTHYSKEITDAMTEQLCAGENPITMDNYKERLDNFGKYVKNYNYKVLLDGKE